MLLYDYKIKIQLLISAPKRTISTVSKIKMIDTSLFQLGSQHILSKLKHLCFSALDSLSKQTQASLLGSNYFVNKFWFNLVAMFVFFVNNSLVINSI